VEKGGYGEKRVPDIRDKRTPVTTKDGKEESPDSMKKIYDVVGKGRGKSISEKKETLLMKVRKGEPQSS